MALQMNLSAGGVYTVPRGYPVRLLPAWESMMSGVVPKYTSAVSAIVQTESGTAIAHLALYTMPTTSGGVDQALVAQTDVTGLTSTAQTITVSVPASAAPACYVVRLWVSSIAGTNAETVSRDGAAVVANEPRVPVAVKVTSMSVS